MTCLTIFYIITFHNMVFNIVLLALLVFGLVLCKKHSFSEGFYFFLILIISKIYPFIYSFTISPLIKNYIDNFDYSNNTLPMGMTMGEMITIIAYINRSILLFIELSAYIFLVVGLFRLWNTKKNS